MTKKFKFLKKAPKTGQSYYLLTPDGGQTFYRQLSWDDTVTEHKWLKAHRVYPTIKDAKRAAKFVKDFIKSHKEQLNYISSEPKPGTEVWSGIDMDGSKLDCKKIPFDSKDEKQQLLLEWGLLYSSPDILKAASKTITKALAKERKRFKYKFLTEAPEPGTIVYYPHLGFALGFDELEWHPNFSAHVRYLNLGLLFSKKKHAIRANIAMLNQINPMIPKLRKSTEQRAFLTKEEAHE